MMNSPKISVIIPCYNYHAFLPDACESLLAQTFINWECILINNGRFPETEKVTKKYVTTDPRFIYLESENNGPSSARNLGLQQAKGEYIQFLDADDKLANERFDLLITLLDATDADLVYSGVRYFTTEEPNTYKSSLNDLNDLGKNDHSGNGSELYNLLLKQNIFAINAPLFKHSLIENGFNEKYKHLEDWDFWLRLSDRISGFAFVANENAIAAVRSHPNSLSRDASGMKVNFLPILVSNIHFTKISLRNLILRWLVAEEQIMDSLFGGKFFLTLQVLISMVKGIENYLCSIALYLFLPIYLPFYLLIKVYRRFASSNSRKSNEKLSSR
jgi:glycosyltransferase involved in cell wall biosynthesis